MRMCRKCRELKSECSNHNRTCNACIAESRKRQIERKNNFIRKCRYCGEKKKEITRTMRKCDKCKENKISTRVGNEPQMYKMWGITDTLFNLCKDSRCVVPYNTVITRIGRHKWDLEKALTEPSRNYSTQKEDKPCVSHAEIKRVTALRWV